MGHLAQYLKKHAQSALERGVQAASAAETSVKQVGDPMVGLVNALPRFWGQLKPEERQRVIGGSLAGSKALPFTAARQIPALRGAAGRIGLWAVPAIEAAEMGVDYSGKGERAYRKGRYDPGPPSTKTILPVTTQAGKAGAVWKHLAPLLEKALSPVDTLAAGYDQTIQHNVLRPLKQMGLYKGQVEEGRPLETGTIHSLHNALIQALAPLSPEPSGKVGRGGLSGEHMKKLLMNQDILVTLQALRKEKPGTKKYVRLARLLERDVRKAAGLPTGARGGLSLQDIEKGVQRSNLPQVPVEKLEAVAKKLPKPEQQAVKEAVTAPVAKYSPFRKKLEVKPREAVRPLAEVLKRRVKQIIEPGEIEEEPKS